MTTYHLNMVLDGSDNLVASYDSLGELRTLWARDAHDYLVSNVGADYDPLGGGGAWYPYFTREDEDGDIQELSFSEVQGDAA
jgi:hypothetical protein